MSVKQIIKEIDSLPPDGKKEVLDYLNFKLRKEQAHRILSQIRGRGKNVLGLDAQEYVNQLRDDDRT